MTTYKEGQSLYLPSILTDRSNTSGVNNRWTRTARSLPEHRLSSRELSFADQDVLDRVVPYRLPRISMSHDLDTEEVDEKVFSRYGYEEAFRNPELGPIIRMINPPQTYSQTERRANLAVPKFRRVGIAPVSVKGVPWQSAQDKHIRDVQIYKSMLAKHKEDEELHSSRPDPSPSPVSRSASPAKSVKSIHWMLGSTKHPLFDHKGRSRYQGPFSREFTVTCIAPTNWMKMKWGRSRTMVH